jgi:DNA polymerase I-like protein with 3'-5' exonuclease and polymerase domains
MSAIELHSGKKISLAFDHAGEQPANPLDFGPDALHILFMACADLGFSLAAGWGLPCNVLDLWVEYRCLTNGLVDNQGEKLEHNIVSACHRYGVYDTTPVAEKEANRNRIMRGFPFTGDEMRRIQKYCDDDVKMTVDLGINLVPEIENLDQAFHRGRCMKAVACIEWNGVPVDVAMLDRLKKNIPAVRRHLIQQVEAEQNFGIYTFDKKNIPHFSFNNYTAWVRRMGFNESTWTFNGARASADDQEVLEPMAQLYADTHPEIEVLRQLRKFLTIAKSEFKFAIGPDGRNRTQMMPFIGSASRHQPPTAQNIPNATKTLRSLLAAHQGEVLMHRDWSNAEYGIAAALANDKKRWDNYLYRDAYLVKAADFGFCDYTATKATHKELRNKFKPVTLAGQYGQTAGGLAKVLGISERQAQTYIDREAKLYPAYQRWLEFNAEDLAFNGYVETEFGFRLWVPYDTSKSMRSDFNGHLTRRALNHPMQGNCAEIMRYASCLATEHGVDLGCTIHDAVMYTAPEDCWEDVDALMVRCMNEACEAVLGDGYILKSARDAVHFPDHYQHEDGKKMWDQIQAALIEAENAPPPPPLPPTFCKYKFDTGDMPCDFDVPLLHQPGDVCGVEVSEGCKWCEDHCKKPETCAVHKPLEIEYTGGTR